MHYSMIRAANIAQEQRADQLRQAAQERLIRRTQAEHETRVKARRRAWSGWRIRMMWHKVPT